MKKALFFVFFQILSTYISALASVDYRWIIGSEMNGELVAAIENQNGSHLLISCTSGPPSGPNLEYDPTQTKLDKETSIQVMVGDETTFFKLGSNGLAHLDSRGARLQLQKLVRDIIDTHATQLVVELPRQKTSEAFSLKDAAKVLR